MSEKHGPTGPSGTVTVGNLLVSVTPITQAEERALRRALKAAAKLAVGDYFTRSAALLKAMEANPAAYRIAVERLVDLTATGPVLPESLFRDFLESPEAVQLELYHRGKKATPELTLAGLKAVVTEANVDDVASQLDAVLSGGGGEKKGPTPPPSQA